MSDAREIYIAKFTDWLDGHHPDVLEAAREYISTRPGWDLDDGVDAVDSEVYNYWSEFII